ncbi:hypothetical protein TNCV_4099171 [Trichonephila clavipes]|nr:hypothetical protein TNCV_4099171 [Trichonephila clavipes]
MQSRQGSRVAQRLRLRTRRLRVMSSSHIAIENSPCRRADAPQICCGSLCHTPGLALHTTVAGKCLSSPEDEQEKQGESRDSVFALRLVIPIEGKTLESKTVHTVSVPSPLIALPKQPISDSDVVPEVQIITFQN